eukprot:TRINITY_DN153_c0_g3_i3.p1 TRINITY_DN153_c0_g3~~TRINITY_DN153_c0_g3_i3.p1  ORF type:complete len:481 (+),score=121.68 TRINITY_DN153_c0_g3_i3:1341-2783(+)
MERVKKEKEEKERKEKELVEGVGSDAVEEGGQPPVVEEDKEKPVDADVDMFGSGSAATPAAPLSAPSSAPAPPDGAASSATVAATTTPSSASDPPPSSSETTAATEPSAAPSFDMFSETLSGIDEVAPRDRGGVVRSQADAWDDDEGYYRISTGETFYSQYTITATHGSGVFSTVAMAYDTARKKTVAIKIVRNRETMYREGIKERDMLLEIGAADPGNKKHCVQMVDWFEYRNHLCLVLEPMEMNLREVTKKYGKNRGISLSAVRSYGQQIFVALRHLEKCRIIHADIKPDNIVVDASRQIAKLCDFGSSSKVGSRENQITPYLVSRFYRAPEIILGLPYGPQLDIWAIGCVLFELFTGKIMFSGKTNNEMLHLHMTYKGMFPMKMLKKASFRETHFDTDGTFLFHAVDLVSNLDVVKRTRVTKNTRSVLSALQGVAVDRNAPAVRHLADLLEKCFVLDPLKRCTVTEALKHPFFRSDD